MVVSAEVLEPATPRGLLSPFSASSGDPWETARQSPPSPTAAPPLAAGTAGSLGDGPRRKSSDAPIGRLSISISRQPATLGQCKPAPALWRESTAVSESAASQGLSFAALCGGSYISPDDLHKPKPLGEGAFAGGLA